MNIHRVEWRSSPPLALGSKIAFVARFLGRQLAYTYEVVELDGRGLVMRTADGPFPMETRYAFEATVGGTRMRLRNRGAPSGFGKLLAPFVARAMRRANEADLRALKALLEAR